MLGQQERIGGPSGDVAIRYGGGADSFVLLGCGVFSILGLATPNPLLTAAAMLIPGLIYKLLWRPGEPPVLAFAASFQWLQVVSPVLAANFEGRPITDHVIGGYMLQAAWLSQLAILALIFGMATALRPMPIPDPEVTRSLSNRLSSKKLFLAYLAGLVLSVGFIWVSNRAGGLRQPILALALIKWIPLFLLCWSTLQCDKPKGFMILAVCIEIAIGMTGFFSSFKNALFLLLVVVCGTASERPRLPISQLAMVSAVAIFLVTFWQAVKSDYREFLNQGTGQQVVLVPIHERIKFIANSATEVTPEQMVEGFAAGVDRLGYITYFAYSIQNVPKFIPHQNGRLWIDSVKHVFTPRILFPDKPILRESERTNHFTGLAVADHRQGTAISIGYIGESYIDFGPWFMAIPIFLLGYFFGWIYRFFVSKDPDHLIGFAIATAILLFTAMLIETSNIKLVGGVTTSLLAFGCLQFFARDKLLELVTESDSDEIE